MENGYVRVKRPHWYTGEPSASYCLEHNVVSCAHAKLTELPPSCVTHHKDRQRWNNHPDNLEIMTDAAHRHLHMMEDRHRKNQERKAAKYDRLRELAAKHFENLKGMNDGL
jgi:hypothetical protein